MIHLLFLLVFFLGVRGFTCAQVPDVLKNVVASPNPTLQGGARLGNSVATEGGYVIAGAPYDDWRAKDSGVVKVFDASTGEQRFLLHHPQPLGGECFGWSVAISGTCVVVGAMESGYSVNGVTKGEKVFVFDLEGPNPATPIHVFDNPTPGVQNQFGYALAVSGTRIVVGARYDNTGAADTGRAYVYDLTSATPTMPRFFLNNPGPAARDYFGSAVAVSGTRVVVGAPQDDTGATDAGSVYVYDVGGASPTVPVAVLNNPAPAAVDFFGHAVATDENRVIVGDPLDDTSDSNAGSVYVYDFSGGSVTTPSLTLNGPAVAGDQFGSSVSLSGSCLAVGAQRRDEGAINAGGAYVYDLAGTTPAVPTFALTNPAPGAEDLFGSSLALSETRLVVGAGLDDTSATDAGSAYVYELSGSTAHVPALAINSPGPEVGDRFGGAVATSGIVMVVGAPQENHGADKAGRAYVYDLASGSPVLLHVLDNPSPTPYAAFGQAVGISGRRVLVGAPQNNTQGGSGGGVYVFDLNSPTPTLPVLTLANPSLAIGSFFGATMAISGSRVVVGAYFDNTTPGGSGKAYVFDLDSASPSYPLAVLTNPEQTYSYFGSGVAIEGQRVVIGRKSHPTGAYVYDLASGTPTVPKARLMLPNPTVFDGSYGINLGISGTRVLIAAAGAFTATRGIAGRVFVYDLSEGEPAGPSMILESPVPAVYDGFGKAMALSSSWIAVSCDDLPGGGQGAVHIFNLNGAVPQAPVATLQVMAENLAWQRGTLVTGNSSESSVAPSKGQVRIFGPLSPDQDNDGLHDSWEYAWWSDPSNHGPMDDEDQDGVVNLLEMAFGRDPTRSEEGVKTPLVNEGGYLTLTLTKHPGAVYVIQSAGSLVPEHPDYFKAATTTVLIDSPSMLKVRDNIPMDGASARFMRVQVTGAP